MSFENTEERIEELIHSRLAKIEEAEQVTILYAVETGSRAWGFASPDSDYDVRFIYVRPIEYYLRLEDRKDFIDWELNETLDINGWDLSKALQHFHKSNAVLYEWNNSPIVYRTTPEWKKIRASLGAYFSCKACIYHYYATAKKNYFEYLKEEQVKYKKYFYVLRPLLACRWIERKHCPPPVRFDELTDAVLEEEQKEVVDRLLQAKVRMTESEKGRRIDELNEYMEQRLAEYETKLKTMPDDRNRDWEALDQLFFHCVTSCPAQKTGEKAQ